MKQATTKKILRSLVVLQLGIILYYPSINHDIDIDKVYASSTNTDTTAGAIKIVNDVNYNETHSVLSGVFESTNEILEDSNREIENNNADIVGIPLEDATMTEEGEVAEAVFEPYVMYVSPSWLNVRSTPSTEENNIIGKLNINNQVLVIGEYGEDNWVIIDYNGTPAYISSEFIQETSPELETYNNEWTGKKLNRHDGAVYGPSGKETYYNLNMSRCIYYMQRLGYYEHYWVRSDGVKMYGNWVMGAANLSIYPKGSIVKSTLGDVIICDTGEFTRNGSGVALDIAVTW